MTTFISYSRINSEFAVRLAKDLKSAGYDVWLDQLDISAGARWDDEIGKALETSDTFMIVLSPESIQSQNVKDEIGYAIDAGKNILPVVIQNCNIPYRLRRFQYVDFTGKPYEESLVKIKYLLGDIRELARAEKDGHPQIDNLVVIEKLAIEPKLVSIDRPDPVTSRQKSNSQLIVTIAGIILIVFVILFKDKFIKTATIPVVGVTVTADMVISTPTIVSSTVVETGNQNPKMKRDNVTNLLMSGTFDQSLRSLAKEKYSNNDYVSRTAFDYTISLDQSKDLVWHWHWCAKDEAILIRNFEHISATFSVNGQGIPSNELVEDQYTDNGSVCRVYYVTLYDWTAGTHHLKNIVTINQLINDGWSDYPEGDRNYDYIVYVKP